MKKAKSEPSRSATAKMHEIGTFEAKTHLSELLEEVARGKSFTITKRGKPVAELRPVSSSSSENQLKRKGGFWKGRKVVISTDFDAPLPEFQEYM